MRLELTKQECVWLADLVKKDKLEYEQHYNAAPNYIYLLRRDNMASLENKIESAIQRQILRERGTAR
jgi:hypothetical protein